MNKKQKIISFVVIIIMILAIMVVYFLKIYPVKTQISLKQNELTNEEKILATVQDQNLAGSNVDFKSTVELQKKLPVKALVQQLLLDLEKAEVVSKSFIKNIAIAEDAGANGTNSSTQVDNNNASSEQQKVNETESIDNTNLPSGLQKVAVTMNVQSPTYVELESFLSSLESMKRIIVVESITFTGEEELISIEQNVESLNYTVMISVFYAPVLVDLQEDIPRMEKNLPIKKKNPFYNSPNSNTDNSSEN